MLTLGLGLLVASSLLAREPAHDWLLREPSEIEWQPAKFLPPGAEMAVLEGDPAKEGFFTMRIKMPDGYHVPPHWHSKQERITVLAGVLNLGTGDEFDPDATKPLGVGTYSSMPPRMTHFAWMTGETVLQLSSIGPWTVTYVRPEDAPHR